MREIEVPSSQHVRALLQKMNEEWSRFKAFDKVVRQINAISGTRGTVWYVDLVLSSGVEALPSDAPNPLPGGLEVFDLSGQPLGTLFVWLENGYINSVEFGAYQMELIDHYPAVEETRLIKLSPTLEEVGLEDA